MTFKLISANIKNYRSLEDINLKFRNLTILVGANSSGKSNCLQALQFLNTLLRNASTPPLELMERILRLDTEQICYEILVEDEEQNKAKYSVAVKVDGNQTLIAWEYLIINETKVIEIKDGKGTVRDEDGNNSQNYESDYSGDNLALTDAGKLEFI
jgi:AAA15 family ATPase/GTPase